MLALTLDQVRVSYPGLETPVLDIRSLAIAAEECVAVTGPSGSGKTTLVNIITGLARPDQGRVLWGAEDIAALPEARRDRWRAETVGLVMQDFHLFEGLSALDNVLLPARLRRAAGRDTVDHAHALLARVGIKRANQSTATLSRGEMQRVAVARALLRRPKVLIADEPTASLDPGHGAEVAELLLSLARESGATLIAVSHDERLIKRMDRSLALSAGRLANAAFAGLAA
ncbi:ABC transporter ATP-binding protein [Aestuariivirga sp. YIM B02566]|uniref:ABC transporter ATP-binding protein n=1 Tax=Taklimakanibacter albus TaxID=2800327 RepID=A0ACC5R0J2_9HYPH|nr:ABC transporter ATP-binding protein [Aestuariivirga sp. YIM B02566]MBK1866176.1 ABC transporter ATP-binding protein [Aestuariivirga sp. YIM B02566]